MQSALSAWLLFVLSIAMHNTVSASLTCQACASGTYCFEETLLHCPIGSSSPTGSISFSDCVCSPGLYMSNSQCKSCPVGSYCPGDNTAVLCPQKTTSSENSFELTHCVCDRGYEQKTDLQGHTDCHLCVAGFSKNVPGNEACTACALNSWRSSVQDSFTCASCPANTITLNTGSDALANCLSKKGFFQTLSGEAGQECPAGTYQQHFGATSCVECAASNAFSSSSSLESLSQCAACPADSRVLKSRATSITDCVCNAGYTGNDGGPCEACLAGTYKESHGDSACTDCPINTYSTATAAIAVDTCQNCRSSSKSTAGAASESECLCVEGYELQGSVCVSCQDGHVSSLGTSCSPCPNNEYQKNGSSCSPCPSVKVSPAASYDVSHCVCPSQYEAVGNECRQCTPGTSNSNQDSTCTPCAVGSYSDISGALSCIGCSDGSSTTGTGSATLAACVCEAGFYGSNNVCAECSAGKFSAENEQSCTNCPVNTYSSHSASTECVPCHSNAVSEIASISAADCVCDAGYTLQNSECVACLSGKFKPLVGNHDCQNCALGTYEVGGSVCEPCPVNTWGGGTECYNCPTNSVSALRTKTLTSCLCKPGYYNVTTHSAHSCHECPLNTFKDSDNNEICTACPPGRYTVSTSSVAEADCLVCAFNNYVNEVTKACESCPVNSESFAESAGVSSCVCKPGFTRDMASGECIACPPSTFKALRGNQPCTSCAIGSGPRPVPISPAVSFDNACRICSADTYSIGNIETRECRSCPANTTSLVNSSSLLQCKCKPGFEGPNAGPCSPCFLGFYKETAGPEACSQCPFNTYNPTAAAKSASSCLPCTANSITLAPGQRSVSNCLCKHGYGISGSHHELCEQCVSGKFTSILDTYCMGCPANMYYPISMPPFATLKCALCPGNSTSNESSYGLHSCVCKSGFTRVVSSLNATVSCVPCLHNHYCPTETTTLQCPDHSSSKFAAKQISDCSCDPGYHRVADTCVPCAVDFFCEGTLHAPVACEQNASTWSQSAEHTCTCKPGYFNTDHNDLSGTTCKKCPKDSFCYMGDETKCPENSSAVAYSTNIMDCLCHPGFEFKNALCRECSENELCLGGHEPSRACAKNSSSFNDKRCLCNPGTHCEDIVSCETPHTCNVCTENHYCNNNTQTLCPTYMHSPAASSSKSECQCAEGAYRLGDTCFPCPLNSYCPIGSVQSCTQHDEFLVTLAVGAKTKDDCVCPPGYFRTSKTDRCKPCPANFYCPSEADFALPNIGNCIENAVSDPKSIFPTQCVCPLGFALSADAGIMKCLACEPGQRCAGGQVFHCFEANRIASDDHRFCVCKPGFHPINQECVACPPGSFKTLKGDHSCELCPADTFNVDGETCAPCPPHSSSEPGSLVCLCDIPRVFDVSTSTCVNCNANEFSHLGKCRACPQNSSSAVGSAGISSCQCNSGFYRQETHNTTACLLCPANTYEVNGVCTACPFGASSLPGSSSHLMCHCNASKCQRQVWGPYSECQGSCRPEAIDCEACPPGFHKPLPSAIGNADECLACQPSTFQPQFGSPQCKQCHETREHFLHSQNTSTPCECKPGFEPVDENSSSPCKPCDLGYYKPETGDFACTKCEIGRYADVQGRTSCFLCATESANTPYNQAANTTLALASTSISQCVCDSGHFLLPVANGSVCTRCIPGSFKSLPGMHNCQFCGAPTYNGSSLFFHHYGSAVYGETSDASCQACPANSGQNSSLVGPSLALDSIADCKCFWGFTNWTEQSCSQCPSYMYKLGFNNDECLQCPAGHYFDDHIHPCVPCELNSFDGGARHDLLAVNSLDPDLLWGTTEADCDCRLGYERTNDDCTACGLGSYRLDRTIRTCVPCHNDTFANTTGLVTCHQCPPFSSTRGVSGAVSISSCICDLGYEFNADSRTCELCPAGTYRNNLGMLQCVQCPQNTYSDEGAIDCISCAVNERSNVRSPAFKYCTCNPGFGGGPPGSATHDECRPCPPGSFSGGGIVSDKASNRRPTCTSCPAGKNCSTASTEINDCQCIAGYGVARDALPETPCIACTSGRFSPGGENKPCLSCGWGAISEPASNSLDDCECDASIGVKLLHVEV